jgi:hypothetical protein
MPLPLYGPAEEIAVTVTDVAGPEAGFATGAGRRTDGGFGA